MLNTTSLQRPWGGRGGGTEARHARHSIYVSFTRTYAVHARFYSLPQGFAGPVRRRLGSISASYSALSLASSRAMISAPSTPYNLTASTSSFSSSLSPRYIFPPPYCSLGPPLAGRLGVHRLRVVVVVFVALPLFWRPASPRPSARRRGRRQPWASRGVVWPLSAAPYRGAAAPPPCARSVPIHSSESTKCCPPPPPRRRLLPLLLFPVQGVLLPPPLLLLLLLVIVVPREPIHLSRCHRTKPAPRVSVLPASSSSSAGASKA